MPVSVYYATREQVFVTLVTLSASALGRRFEFIMCPARMSKIESAIRAVLAFHEAFNRHDVAGMMQLMSDDCKIENSDPAPDGTVYTGKETVSQYWTGFFSASPQIRIEIEEIFGFGERCIMRGKYSAVNEKGEKTYVRGVDIFRVRSGIIREKLSYVKG